MPLVPTDGGRERKNLSALVTILLQHQPLAAATCSSYFLPKSSQKRAEIKIVVQSFHVSNDLQLRHFYDRYKKQPMTGIITNAIHPLADKERRGLEKVIPGRISRQSWSWKKDGNFLRWGSSCCCSGVRPPWGLAHWQLR